MGIGPFRAEIHRLGKRRGITPRKSHQKEERGSNGERDIVVFEVLGDRPIHTRYAAVAQGLLHHLAAEANVPGTVSSASLMRGITSGDTPRSPQNTVIGK